MREKPISAVSLLLPFLLTFLFNSLGHSACRNPNVAGDSPFITYAAASGPVEIKWFGHSFFQITSSLGTKIITDPFGSMGFPMPEVWADVVTVGREHGNHNNVALVKGKPVVLRGLKEGGNEWDDVNLTYRDVLIYNVPVHQRGVPNYATSLKGAAFVSRWTDSASSTRGISATLTMKTNSSSSAMWTLFCK